MLPANVDLGQLFREKFRLTRRSLPVRSLLVQCAAGRHKQKAVGRTTRHQAPPPNASIGDALRNAKALDARTSRRRRRRRITTTPTRSQLSTVVQRSHVSLNMETARTRMTREIRGE